MAGHRARLRLERREQPPGQPPPARQAASKGFVHEGTLRECLLRDGRFVSLHLLSILEGEFRQA